MATTVVENSRVISSPEVGSKSYDKHRNVRGSSDLTLAYPPSLGSESCPAWIKFTIYGRKLAARTNQIKTIGLYMPENASMPSTASWENEKVGMRGHGVLNAINTMAQKYESSSGKSFANELTIGNINDELIKSVVGEMGSAAVDMGTNVAQQGAAGLLNKAINAATGREGTLASNLSMAVGAVPNPFLTAVYRGTDFRSFSFSFNLFPHNEEECELIMQIIQSFREAALPKAQTNYIRSIPLEFDIAYMFGSKVNTYIHRFKPSVCTGIDLNYTGNGSWTVMRNAMPASIILNLKFSEIEIVTRGDVEKGY